MTTKVLAERPRRAIETKLPEWKSRASTPSAEEAGRVPTRDDTHFRIDAAPSAPETAGSATRDQAPIGILPSQPLAPETARPVHEHVDTRDDTDGAILSAAKRRRTKEALLSSLAMSAETLSDVHTASATQADCDIGRVTSTVRLQTNRHTKSPTLLGESPAEVQSANDAHRADDFGPLIDEIREQWKRRQAWHRAEKSLTLQAKAMCRRLVGGDIGDAEKLYQAATKGKPHDLAHVAVAAMYPLLGARDHIEPQRKLVEKRLAKLAKELPVSVWVEDQRGVGIASLAAIVGEAGDLSKYSNPAKLWKRMGMAVMQDGKRQRKVEGVAALEHGYSPSRRSVMWNIGDCMVKAGGSWRALYDERKAYEIVTAQAAGLTVCPAGKIPKKNPEAYRSDGHVHNRAKRYIEKRFLRELWKAWRRTILEPLPTPCVSASDL